MERALDHFQARTAGLECDDDLPLLLPLGRCCQGATVGRPPLSVSLLPGGRARLAGASRLRLQVDVGGLVALDSGLSTGGFTDCLLQRGAAKVYGVDVGYGQVAEKIRTDPRVVVMERTNVR